MNPPGREFCINCHAPLTLAADSGAVQDTPEAEDELRNMDAPEEDAAEVGDLDRTGGGPLPESSEAFPTEVDRGF
jgi:hypothetical protein